MMGQNIWPKKMKLSSQYSQPNFKVLFYLIYWLKNYLKSLSLKKIIKKRLTLTIDLSFHPRRKCSFALVRQYCIWSSLVTNKVIVESEATVSHVSLSSSTQKTLSLLTFAKASQSEHIFLGGHTYPCTNL
jgi:hypothetical protein